MEPLNMLHFNYSFSNMIRYSQKRLWDCIQKMSLLNSTAMRLAPLFEVTLKSVMLFNCDPLKHKFQYQPGKQQQ